MAETIIALGKAFDMTTVAEGVETPEQFEMLAHLGCDQSQGYLHSRPHGRRRHRAAAAEWRAPALQKTLPSNLAGNVARPPRLTAIDNFLGERGGP